MAIRFTSRGLVNDGAIAALSRNSADSAAWTGRESAPGTAEAPRMETAPKLKPCIDASIMHDAALAEYKTVAAEIGVSAQDILVDPSDSECPDIHPRKTP